jgi:hypothetical protein
MSYHDIDVMHQVQDEAREFLDGLKPERTAGSLRERKQLELQGLLVAAEALEKRITKVTMQIETLSRFPDEDPYEDGTTLEFTRDFPNGEKTYDYSARRANGVWYVTGTRSPNGVRWSEFINWLGLGLVGELKVMVPQKPTRAPRKRSTS